MIDKVQELTVHFFSCNITIITLTSIIHPDELIFIQLKYNFC